MNVAPRNLFEHPVGCPRLTPELVIHRHPFAVRGVPRDGRADFPLLARQLPADNPMVTFLHLPAGELGGKGDMGGVRLGHDQAPAGPSVEAVDDAGPGDSADSAQLSGAMVEQGIDEGVLLVSRGGVDHQPRRLVEHHQRLIFVENAQRHLLGLGLGRPRFGPMHLHFFPGARRVGRLDGAAIDPDMALFNEPLERAPRDRRKAPPQVGVQPL